MAGDEEVWTVLQMSIEKLTGSVDSLKEQVTDRLARVETQIVGIGSMCVERHTNLNTKLGLLESKADGKADKGPPSSRNGQGRGGGGSGGAGEAKSYVIAILLWVITFLGGALTGRSDLPLFKDFLPGK